MDSKIIFALAIYGTLLFCERQSHLEVLRQTFRLCLQTYNRREAFSTVLTGFRLVMMFVSTQIPTDSRIDLKQMKRFINSRRDF